MFKATRGKLDITINPFFLFVYSVSQLPECRASPKKSTEPAVDLLGLGKTWAALHQLTT